MIARRPLQFPQRKNPEHTAATPSEPTTARGRSVSRKRSIRGKCNHGSSLRQPCRCSVRGTCMRTLCEYWHPPECQFFQSETGRKGGDKCLFPHYNVDEQPNKKPKKSYFPKRRESDDKNAVAIVKSVSQLGGESWKTRCRSLRTSSKGAIHLVYATSCEYPGKERTIAWENTSQTSKQGLEL